MADQLEPRVVGSTDTTEFDRGTNKYREFTITTFYCGELGPFTSKIPKDEFSRDALREEMRRKAAAFE